MSRARSIAACCVLLCEVASCAAGATTSHPPSREGTTCRLLFLLTWSSSTLRGIELVFDCTIRGPEDRWCPYPDVAAYPVVAHDSPQSQCTTLRSQASNPTKAAALSGKSYAIPSSAADGYMSSTGYKLSSVVGTISPLTARLGTAAPLGHRGSRGAPSRVTKSCTRRDPHGTPGPVGHSSHTRRSAYTGPDLRFLWSGRRDSNPRPPPWQGGALPLSHVRVNLRV
jgi:hypothetical protein